MTVVENEVFDLIDARAAGEGRWLYEMASALYADCSEYELAPLIHSILAQCCESSAP